MNLRIDWFCRHTWKTASFNTSWCLLGCSIGDFGTIAYFQFMEISWPVWLIMCLAIFNGLITSIILFIQLMNEFLWIVLFFLLINLLIVCYLLLIVKMNKVSKRQKA